MAFMREIQQVAIGADGDNPQGEIFAAGGQSSAGGVFQPAAAGHFHAQQGDALNIIGGQNSGKLFGVIKGIQLGAADEGNAPLHKITMKISIGIGGTIGGDEQMRPGKAGSSRRNQADLAGPLGQLRGRSTAGGGGGAALEQLGGGTGAAVKSGFFLCHVLLDSRFIVGSRFPLHKGDGAGGAGGQTVPQTVAVVIAQQTGFAADHTDGTFVTGGSTNAAAIAFFFIYVDNSTDHRKTSLR